jgi:hypothetical protein
VQALGVDDDAVAVGHRVVDHACVLGEQGRVRVLAHAPQ